MSHLFALSDEQLVQRFAVVDLSNFYFDIAKDRLYTGYVPKHNVLLLADFLFDNFASLPFSALHVN